MASKKTTYTPVDYTKLFDQLKQSEKQALTAAYERQLSELMASLPGIQTEYDNLRNQTYTNARLNAIGNNEALAAKGLAGNAYTGPTSGYSETARVADNNHLRNALNAANTSQLAAEGQVHSAAKQAAYDKDLAISKALSALEQLRLQYQQRENQFAADYNQQQQANELTAAYKEISTFGRVMTKRTAQLLGIPVGTVVNVGSIGSGGGKKSGSKSSGKSTSATAKAAVSVKSGTQKNMGSGILGGLLR